MEPSGVMPWVERLGALGAVLALAFYLGKRFVDGVLKQMEGFAKTLADLVDKVEAGKCRAPGGPQ